MNRDRKKFRLYAVTDSRQLHGRSLPQAVEEVIKGGATMIQLREKDAKDSRLLKLAGDVLSVTDRYAVPLIINDRPDIALQCGAAGVHIGQQDGSVRQIRRMIGEEKILGVSAHTKEEAVRAEQDGADYLGVGAVFPTSTKQNTVSLSPETLREICRAVKIPVVAIGGIRADNIGSLCGTGIDGAAVVSALFASENPKKAAEQLTASLNAAGIGEVFSLSSRSVSGAIFDVDGTILDSMEMWRTTGSRFLRKCGVTPPPDIDRLMFQITLEEGASLFGEKFGIEGTPEEIKARVLQMVRDDYRYRLSCKPGVVDVIRELYSAGIPLCVATATDRELILPAFERLGLLPFFREIFTCGELGVSKRSPDIYLQAAERLGTPPEKTLVFEDVLHAVRSAASVGFPVVAIYDKNAEPEKETIRTIASLYLDSFADWPGLAR